MLRAVIYARYSSHNQREESIEGQLRECHAYAKMHEMTVVGEYADRAISGKTDKRPEFQRLIRDSGKSHFDVVICYKVDRFARNRYDSATYKAKLRKNGVRVVYAKEHIPDSPEGIILESVLEGFAEYYSANLAQNISRGLYENALKCRVMGACPLGYRKGPDGCYEIDPAGAKAVVTANEMICSGSNIKQIISYLNEQGFRTSRGVPFNKNSLRIILQNRKYIGEYSYKDVVIPDGIPRILTNEQFERTQAILAVRKETIGRKNRGMMTYLLTTKAYCGHCGAPLLGESGTSRNGTLHYYYKCATRKRQHSCTKSVEQKEWLEQVVVEETVRHVLTDEHISLISTQAADLLQKEAADSSLLESLKGQLSSVTTSIGNIMKAIEQGIITTTTKNRLEELEEEKAQLEVRIAEEAISRPIVSADDIAFWLYTFRDGDTADPEYCRRVIDTLVSRVDVFDDGDGHRKFEIYYNLTSDARSTLKCSDKDSEAPLQILHFDAGSFVLYPCFASSLRENCNFVNDVNVLTTILTTIQRKISIFSMTSRFVSIVECAYSCKVCETWE